MVEVETGHPIVGGRGAVQQVHAHPRAIGSANRRPMLRSEHPAGGDAFGVAAVDQGGQDVLDRDPVDHAAAVATRHSRLPSGDATASPR